MVAVEDIARIAFTADRELQLVTQDPDPCPPWDEAEPSVRQVTICGVRHIQEGYSPQEQHQMWRDLREEHGWKHGPVKDENAKTDPLLVPYSKLHPRLRLRNDLFGAIVTVLSREA
ncbi:RyR domain-containing protein [Streptomyces tauricus]|uniref:RyR domain-containing protein n=1 Tax=Streptomyces tauricus TaxID=68274 RepID=UPI00387F3257